MIRFLEQISKTSTVLKFHIAYLTILTLVSTCIYAGGTPSIHKVDSMNVHIKIPLSMTDADTAHTTPVTIYFGIDPRATDCVDSSLGEFYTNTGCGNTSHYCAQFQDPFGGFSLCNSFPVYTDLRPYKKATQVDSYKVTFSGKYPIVFHWSPNLSLYYDSASIYDGLCGCIYNVDMLSHTSLVISAYTINTVIIRTTGPFNSTAVNPDNPKIPNEFSLEQNFPNPFNPTTSIQYSVNSTQYVSLKVYDMFGREVARLVNEHKSPGNYEVQWNADGVASGVYFYRLITPTSSLVRKMDIIR